MVEFDELLHGRSSAYPNALVLFDGQYFRVSGDPTILFEMGSTGLIFDYETGKYTNYSLLKDEDDYWVRKYNFVFYSFKVIDGMVILNPEDYMPSRNKKQ